MKGFLWNIVRLGAWAAFTAVAFFLFLVWLDYGSHRFFHGLQKESLRLGHAAEKRLRSGAH